MGAADADSTGVRVVGRYALYGSIASGGMATVHLGRLMGPVGFTRTVAIKRLHAQFAQDPDFVSMFLDEARLAARIRHPNVVQTLDVVATGGELFLVMDYVPGESLSRLARTAREKKQRMPLRIVSAVMSSVLHGLHAAHEAKSERGEPLGIVHRDVSPQNVLVGTDGVARVLDFGVAKAAGRTQETREGQIKGKLSYMPPEQLRGTPVSRQSDIYAAGVVLWELLTGERLFSADNEGALLAKVLEGEISPPSRHIANPDRTSEAYAQLQKLDVVTLRALEGDPERRYATAREMAIALERCVPPATPSEVGEWVEGIAADVIHKRAELVAEIESSASLALPRTSTVMSSLGTPIPIREAPAGGGEGDRTRTEVPQPAPGDSQLSSISVAGPPAPSVTSAKRSGGAAAAKIGAVLGIAVLAAAFTFMKREPHSAVMTPATVAPAEPQTQTAPRDPAPIAIAVSAVPVAAPETSGTSAAPAPISTQNRKPARVQPPRPPQPQPQPPPQSTAAPAPTSTTPAASDCVFYDAKGIKHVNATNPKCLQ